MNITKKLGFIICVLALGVWGMNSLSDTSSKTRRKASKEVVRAVEAENLNFGTLELSLKKHAVIATHNEMLVVSDVEGRIVFARNDLRNGTYVQKDELLVEIDSREAHNQLLIMKAKLISSIAELQSDRLKHLVHENKWDEFIELVEREPVIPDLPEMPTVGERIRASKVRINEWFYRIKNQEILLENHRHYAQFDGQISSSGLKKNQFVTRGETLFTLTDVTNIELEFSLNDRELAMVDTNANPRIVVQDQFGHKIEGQLDRISDIVDQNTQSIKAYGLLKNTKRLGQFFPGKIVQMQLHGRVLTNVAKVPRSSVTDNKIYYVKDDQLERTGIQIVARQDDSYIIENTFGSEIYLIRTELEKPIVGMKVKIVGNDPAQDVMSNNEVDGGH